MKKFACGDIVPGCDAQFVGSSEEDILAEVASHAAEVHQLSTVPPELVDQVRERIQVVA